MGEPRARGSHWMWKWVEVIEEVEGGGGPFPPPQGVVPEGGGEAPRDSGAWCRLTNRGHLLYAACCLCVMCCLLHVYGMLPAACV